ncbi:MAG TPA: PEGA domain-containing protein [Polyangiaceae bacterium]
MPALPQSPGSPDATTPRSTTELETLDLVPIPEAAATALAPQAEASELEPPQFHQPQPEPPQLLFPNSIESVATSASPDLPAGFDAATRMDSSELQSIAGTDPVRDPVSPRVEATDTSEVAAVSVYQPAAASTVGRSPEDASIGFAPRRARRFGFSPVVVVAWLATAILPATVVWLVMRQPKAPAVALRAEPSHQKLDEYSAQPGAERRPLETRAAAVPNDVATAAVTAASEPEPANGIASEAAGPEPVPQATEASASSDVASESSQVPNVPSAASAAPTPVLVQTEASDRVDVLVKSKPTGARIYRMGKEIGRTPAVIQIGRGEHRVFEVGSPSAGTKRISLDGEKSEVTVTLASAAPPPVLAPAPLPEKKYERLR